jgi:hypothetical protein
MVNFLAAAAELAPKRLEPILRVQKSEKGDDSLPWSSLSYKNFVRVLAGVAHESAAGGAGSGAGSGFVFPAHSGNAFAIALGPALT